MHNDGVWHEGDRRSLELVAEVHLSILVVRRERIAVARGQSNVGRWSPVYATFADALSDA
jgi:hypothetical protein